MGARIRTLTYSFGDCRAKPLTLHPHCTNKKAPNTFMLGALDVIKKSRQHKPLLQRHQRNNVVFMLNMLIIPFCIMYILYFIYIEKSTYFGNSGGESGIRTLEGRKPFPVFKTGAFSLSANSPICLLLHTLPCFHNADNGN